MNHQSLSSFIWSVADLLRGDYKQSDYGKVILPFTVLRRLDCVLEPTKAAVLAELAEKQKAGLNPEPFLLRKAGQSFYNTSPLDMRKLMGDQDHIAQNLFAYIQGSRPPSATSSSASSSTPRSTGWPKPGCSIWSPRRFAKIDLHPDKVSNTQMGLVFEELIRKFAELSNETAGEHFTPREVIRLMVNLLFIEDDDALTKPGVVRTIYDPTAGTGGMLSVAEEHLAEHEPEGAADHVRAGAEPGILRHLQGRHAHQGAGRRATSSSATPSPTTGTAHKKFDYMLSNPPFGVEWKKVEKEIRKEHETQGFNGRFGPGLPRVSDGSLLFLLHLLRRCAPRSRAAAASASCSMARRSSPAARARAKARSGAMCWRTIWSRRSSACRPTCSTTPASRTYVWILSNRKPEHRKGKVQLIDASGFWQKMRKSLGSKRKELCGRTHRRDHAALRRLHGGEQDGRCRSAASSGTPISAIARSRWSGRLRDAKGKVVLGEKGKRRASRRPTRTCATPRTCRFPKT